MLRAAPAFRILATSREALGVPGETVYRVASLSVPDLLSVLTGEARRLRGHRALRRTGDGHSPDFQVHRTRPKHRRICRRLDGIPLAIELAAAQSRRDSHPNRSKHASQDGFR